MEIRYFVAFLSDFYEFRKQAGQTEEENFDGDAPVSSEKPQSRELAFPEGVLLIGHFSGIVLGAGFHKSQSTVLEQRTGTSRDGLYIRLEIYLRKFVEFTSELQLSL